MRTALTSSIALRHDVNQSDGMAKYGWISYDTREGGRQMIEDVGNKINLITEFIKHSEGQSQGNWGLRIKGMPRPDAPKDLKTTVVFYIGMEAMEACADCKLEARQQFEADEKTVQAVNMNIAHPKLGNAGIHIPVPINADEKREIAYIKTLNVTEDRLWQGKCKYDECHDFFNPIYLCFEPPHRVMNNQLMSMCKKPPSWSR